MPLAESLGIGQTKKKTQKGAAKTLSKGTTKVVTSAIAPVGPFLAESSTVSKAATQQARVIQKYVTDRETKRLEKKHYTYDATGRITKRNATSDEIRADLQEARDRVAQTSRRLYRDPAVQSRIVAGRIVPKERLKQIDQRQRQRTPREEYQRRRKKATGKIEDITYTPKSSGGAFQEAFGKVSDVVSDVTDKIDEITNPDLGAADPFGGTRGAEQPTTSEMIKTGALLAPPARAAELGGLAIKEGVQRLFAQGAKEAAKKVGAAASIKGKTAAFNLSKEGLKTVPGRAGAMLALKPVTGPTGVTGPGIAGFLGTLAERQATAFVDDAPKTTRTTLRTALGLPSAVVGDVIDVGTTGTRAFRKNVLGEDISSSQVLAPLKGVAESQANYWKSVAAIAGPDVDEAQRIVQEELGLIPAISGALGVYGVVKATHAVPAPHLPSVHATRVEHLRKKFLAAPEGNARNEARDAWQKEMKQAPALSAMQLRQRVSERAAVHGEREDMFATLDMIEGGQRSLGIGPKKRIDEMVGRDLSAPIGKGVAERDVISMMARMRLGRDSKDALARVTELRAAVSEIPKEYEGTVHTARVLDAIIKKPELLKDERIHEALDRLHDADLQFAIEAHSQFTGKRETTPMPGWESPKRLHAARAAGIRADWEEIPHELRGVTKVEAKEGEEALKAIREEAQALQGKARTLRTQAKAASKSDADEMEAKAMDYDAEAEVRLAVTDRFKRADRKDMRAAKMEAGQIEGSPAQAQALRVEAEKLREEGDRANALLLEEFISRADARAAMMGDRESIYLPERSVADEATAVTGFETSPGARSGRKIRHRSGALAQSGLLDEDGKMLLRGMYERRARLSDNARRLEAIEMEAIRDPNTGERIFTPKEMDALAAQGVLPAGAKRVKVAEFSPTVQSNRALRDEIRAKRLKVKATHAKGDRQLYMVWEGPSYREFRAQEIKMVKSARILRAAMRVQTGIMLGTSPQWFAYQLIATPLQMSFRNLSPAAWGRSSKMMFDSWQKLTPRERAHFLAETSGNPADFLSMGDVQRGMGPERIASMTDAVRVVDDTPFGRAMRTGKEFLKKGGPLIIGNRRYEAMMRAMQMMLEIDRASGTGLGGRMRITTGMRRMAMSSIKGHDVVAKHFDEMRGLRGEEKIRYYIDNPEKLRELGDAVRENYGEWSALTSRERNFAALVPFFGFLRMSLRWFFYAAPKNHPIRYAIALNMAQQNAQELAELMGGDPAFYSGWGRIVTHTGPEGEKELLDLARAAPGGNVLVETLGGASVDDNKLALALRGLQPAASLIFMTAQNKDVYGRDSDLSMKELLLKGTLNLSPFSRDMAKEIGKPQSRWSELYDAIQDKDSIWDKILPDITPDVQKVQAMEAYQRLLDQAFGEPYSQDQIRKLRNDWLEWNPAAKEVPKSVWKPWVENYLESQAAFGAIDKLMITYGVETKADQKASAKQASKGYSKIPEWIEALEGEKKGGGEKNESSTDTGSYLDQNKSSGGGGKSGGSYLDQLKGGQGDASYLDSIKNNTSSAIGGGGSPQKIKTRLTKAAAKARGGISGPLVDSQRAFGETLARVTGLSPAVVGAWMLAENSDANAVAKEADGYHNWLNIGPFAEDARFQDPIQAAKATAQFLRGDDSSPAGGFAFPEQILPAAGMSDEDQMQAIENSAWSATGYGAGATLDGTYAQVSATKGKPVPKALVKAAKDALGDEKVEKIMAVASPKTSTPHKFKGQWNGAQRAVISVVPKSARADAKGDKRTPEENAAVDGSPTSDHLTTNTSSYAADITGTMEDGFTDDRARAIAEKLGMESWHGTNEITKDGYRYQLIWQDSGHYDHIHLGAQWTGAASSTPVTSSATYVAPGAGVASSQAATGGVMTQDTMNARRNPLKLLKQLGMDPLSKKGGLNILSGTARARDASSADATLEALQGIAETRSRLLGRETA